MNGVVWYIGSLFIQCLFYSYHTYPVFHKARIYDVTHVVRDYGLGPVRLFESWNLSCFTIPGIHLLDPSSTHLHFHYDLLGALSKILLPYNVSHFNWVKLCHDAVTFFFITYVSLTELMS